MITTRRSRVSIACACACACACAGLLLGSSLAAAAAEATAASAPGSAAASVAVKKRVERADDLPRHTYSIGTNVVDTVKNDAKFAAFAAAYRRDTEADLALYDITDHATLRKLLGSLAVLDFLQNDDAAATRRLAQIKVLEDKPADKLLSGLQLGAMIGAAKDAAGGNVAAYRRGVAERIDTALEPMPFEVVANQVREMKASAELGSETLALGYLQNVLQPAVLQAGGDLSSEFAPALIGVRYRLTKTLPLKETLVGAYSSYLDRHHVTKPDIWAARDVTLPPGKPYAPVVVGIWDSGTDPAVYADRMVAKANGQPAVIAFDKYSNSATGALQPLPASVQADLPKLKSRAKGFADLQANIDSPQATEVKRYFSTLKPDDYKAAIETLRLMGNYMHGTHVTGIALAGNPYAQLVVARIEFGNTLKPDPCPSEAQVARDAAASQAYVDFLKANGAQVVNMSWGGSAKDIESDLELCGIGKTTDERKAIARGYFDAGRNALQKAFASAPNILFVAAAGNENSDSTFTESIPAAIVAPNLLTVGAVDRAGDEASFTSYGPTVKVDANGYQVESTIPGGQIVAESGTSMAAPQVTNLAAKLLAVDPRLTPPQLIEMIVSTADKSADGRRTLIDPKKAVRVAEGKDGEKAEPQGVSKNGSKPG